MRLFSFGGGVQSVAAMVLSAQGKLPYTHFIFADVGRDSENPDTLHYIDNVVKEYAERHGLHYIETKWERTEDRAQTLHAALVEDRNDIAIPFHMKGSGPAWRNCTTYWKVKVIDRWAKANGATLKQRIPIGIGISTDEAHRMRTDDPKRDRYTIKEYPLIDLGLRRGDCVDIIEGAGLKIPPKSSCWFCPYKVDRDWAELRRKHPALFDKAIDLEETIQAKRAKFGKRDDVYLWWRGKSLKEFDLVESKNMFDDDDDAELMNCESGHCMT